MKRLWGVSLNSDLFSYITNWKHELIIYKLKLLWEKSFTLLLIEAYWESYFHPLPWGDPGTRTLCTYLLPFLFWTSFHYQSTVCLLYSPSTLIFISYETHFQIFLTIYPFLYALSLRWFALIFKLNSKYFNISYSFIEFKT